jgi:hypothetical protein
LRNRSSPKARQVRHKIIGNAGLFVTSLNEVIDIHPQRDVAKQNHVPEIVLWLLFFDGGP